MLEKRLKKFKKDLQICDISAIKLAVFFFTLWLVGMLPGIYIYIYRWRWIAFVLFILFAIKPFHKFWIKR